MTNWSREPSLGEKHSFALYSRYMLLQPLPYLSHPPTPVSCGTKGKEKKITIRQCEKTKSVHKSPHMSTYLYPNSSLLGPGWYYALFGHSDILCPSRCLLGRIYIFKLASLNDVLPQKGTPGVMEVPNQICVRPQVYYFRAHICIWSFCLRRRYRAINGYEEVTPVCAMAVAIDTTIGG